MVCLVFVGFGVWCVVLNFLLNLLFIWTWPTGWKHAGLAMATVLASAVNGGILSFVLHRRIGGPGWLTVLGTGVKALLGSVVMALVVMVVQAYGELIVVAAAIISGMGTYALWAVCFCRHEIRLIRRSGK